MIRAFARLAAGGVLAIWLVFAGYSAVNADTIVGNGIPNIAYDQVTGQLTVTPDGADISSVLVEGPNALSIDRWLDGTTQDGAEWSQAFVNNREQWIVTGAFGTSGTGSEFVPQGTYQIATYDVNSVNILDFGLVEMASQNPRNTLATAVDLANPEFPFGDYTANGSVEQADLDLVLLNWGTETPPIPAGWDNDFPAGGIDQAELDRVLLNWGTGASTIALATVVPEPASSGLIGVAMLLAIRGLRRNQKRD